MASSFLLPPTFLPVLPNSRTSLGPASQAAQVCGNGSLQAPPPQWVPGKDARRVTSAERRHLRDCTLTWAWLACLCGLKHEDENLQQVLTVYLLRLRPSARSCSCGDQQDRDPTQVALIGQEERADVVSALPWPGTEPGADTCESAACSGELDTFSSEAHVTPAETDHIYGETPCGPWRIHIKSWPCGCGLGVLSAPPTPQVLDLI